MSKKKKKIAALAQSSANQGPRTALHREKWICCSNKFGTVDMPIVNRTTVFVESSDGVVEAKKTYIVRPTK